MQLLTPPAFWAQPADTLLAALQSSAQGLSSAESGARLEQFGLNQPRARPRTDALYLLINQFRSPLVLILLFATGVSAATGEVVDALIVLAIVLGSALLGFVQEFNASNAVERLRASVRSITDVVRDGRFTQVASNQIVPGDVVQLSAGSLVPADGVLLQAQDFYVNESVLTGETFPVEKRPGIAGAGAGVSQRSNCVFMGTNVRSGTARALIVQTGTGTAFGEIAKRLTVREPETDFEAGVRRFGTMLSRLMLVLVVGVFAVNVFFHRPVIDSLLFSIALAVGMTPELLPAIISVTLSKGSREMAKQGVIVRRLNSIENFGSMDVLCTDKTGTLTMGVVQLDGALDLEGKPSQQVMRYAYLNAKLQTGLQNPLDEAILAQAAPDHSGVEKVDEVPYDFVRKRLSVVVREGGQLTMITKGAVENVLAVCSSTERGALDREATRALRKRFTDWSEQGYRVLGVAVRELAQQAGFTRLDESEMRFAGYLIFFDPPKAGVSEVIGGLSSMGVELKIITGDNHAVAIHAAEAIGLKVSDPVTGGELDEMGDEALWQRVERCNLFAEVDPNQKERIILALRKMGHVVGYLGDGINDAPSLHAADVGISVDSAVDVAKEAADFVLLERDLGVLQRGVLMGRTTFANTLKYIYVTSSANFGNMFSMAGASLLLPFLPMLPLQILLTNFMTDFPALTVSSDEVDPEMLERPRRWSVRQIRNFMYAFGGVSSLFDYLTFGLLVLVLHASAVEFRTGWFVMSVITELAVMLSLRTRRPFYRSRVGRALLVSSLAVSVIALALPRLPINTLLGLTPLSLDLTLALTGIALLYVLGTEIAKRRFFRAEIKAA